MRIAVLGTGVVGQTLATKLVELGHEVMMGSRDTANANATGWARSAGDRASNGTFADAAAFGELVVNATGGGVSLAALEAAGEENLAGKILVDVANPLDFSQGMPPTLSVCNTESLGERIQSTYPDAKVVKALNTINAQVMVDPGQIPGSHVLFLCGNDSDAKSRVAELVESFGWPRDRVIDLGDISSARGTEMYVALWMRLMAALGTPNFNIEVTRASS